MEKNQEKEHIVLAKETIQSIELCRHCSIYSEATPPFVPRTYLKGTASTQKLLEKAVKGTDVPPECFCCLSIRSFLKLPDDQKLAELKDLRKHKKN